jgi:hypothetical protein
MESKRLRPDYEWVELSPRYRAIGIGEAGTGGQKQLTWLTAPECLHRDGVTYNAESTLAARRGRALPQPPQGRPAHVRYTAVGPDIGQLTCALAARGARLIITSLAAVNRAAGSTISPAFDSLASLSIAPAISSAL